MIKIVRSSQSLFESDEETVTHYLKNSEDWKICPCGTLLEWRNERNRKDVARIHFEKYDNMTEHKQYIAIIKRDWSG